MIASPRYALDIAPADAVVFILSDPFKVCGNHLKFQGGASQRRRASTFIASAEPERSGILADFTVYNRHYSE